MVIPEYTPISTLQKNYVGIVKKTEFGPVILAQYSKPVAVLLSPVDYERLAGMEVELQRLQRIVTADKHFSEMRAGDYVDMTEEIEAKAAA